MTTETELIYLSKKLIFLETPQTNPLIQEKHYQIFSQSLLFITRANNIHKSPRQNMMVLYTKAGSL